MPYRDTRVACENCEKTFIFTVEEQRRLDQMGMDITPPELCPECRGEETAEELTEGERTGVVKWYEPDKRYGFIVDPSGEEIFFHRSGFAEEAPSSYSEGDRVTYEVEETDKGLQAINVAPAGG